MPSLHQVTAVALAGALARILLAYAPPLAEGLVFRLDEAVALLVTLVLGPVAGVATSLIATASVPPGLSSLPWVAEVVVFGALVRLGWMPVFATTAYWCLLGLLYVTGLLFPSVGPLAASLFWAKQLLNGAVSAILAQMLAQAPPVRRALGAAGEPAAAAPRLRTQIARLIVPLSVLPSVLLGLWLGRLYADRLDDAAATALQGQAASIAAAIDDALTTAREDVQVLAGELGAHTLDASATAEAVLRHHGGTPTFSSLTVRDASGRVVAASRRIGPAPAEVVRPAQAPRDDVAAAAMVLRAPIVPTAGATPTGTVHAVIAPERISALLTGLVRETSAVSAVAVDAAGRIVGAAGARALPAGAATADSPWLAATGAARFGRFADRPGGPTQFAARAPLPDVGFQIHLRRSRRDVQAPIVPFYLLTSVLMTAGILVALPIARLLSRRVTLPLERLAGAAEAVGRGERGAIGRLPLHAPVEVEGLRRNLNTMVERLDDALRHLDLRVQERTAALSVAEALTATILRTASDAMFVVDEHDRVADVNDACCRLLGRSRDELIGAPLADVDRASLAALDARRQRIAQRGELRYDTTLRTAAGGAVPVEVAATALAAGGQFFASARDIRDRLQNEHDRARLEAQLWQSQKMEAIGTLAGGIAHDFNNILTLITGNADLALAALPSGHPAGEKLQHITRATERAEALVRQILAFSRRRDEVREAVWLRPIVDEAVALLRSTLPAMIEIRVEVAGDTPLVHADPVQLNQVLMNLASNAGYAMREHGGTLEVRVETLPGPRPGEPPRGARLVVADTGVGMDRATMARLFEPFFTTKPLGLGSGLGLSVVHGIVAAHGGTIDVQSAPGEGTRIGIDLPASSRVERAPLRLAAGAAALREPSGHGQRVFFVDDEPEIVALACAHLGRLGFAVTGFGLATEALAALDAADPACDVLVTDVAMPRMSGLELAERVRQRDAALPIVLCSGFLSDDDAARADRADVSAVMPKPYSQKELARVLERLLTGRYGEDASPHSPDPSWPGESAGRPSPSWRS